MKTLFTMLLLVPTLAMCVSTGAPPYAQQVKVYPGCESPSNYTRTITVTNLSDAFAKKTIQPGDHVVVTGAQPQLSLSKYSAAYLTTNTKWIWIDGNKATFPGIDVLDMSHMMFTGMTVTGLTPGAGTLVHVAGGSQMIFRNITAASPGEPNKQTVAQWLALPNGFSDDNGTCVALTDSHISNVRTGVQFFTRAKTSDQASVKGLMDHVVLQNVSADFTRPNGSDITFSNNRFVDGWVSMADGDGNHDDFIQGFAYPAAATGGIVYSNVQILDNWMQQSTNPKRPFQAEYQGVDVFDGVFDKLVVRGNTVISSAYWACCGSSETNAVIENNTFVSVNPNPHDRLWIQIVNGKLGQKPSGNVVRNNVAAYFGNNPGSTWTNNIVVGVSDLSKAFTKADLTTMTFDLHPLKGGPLDGKHVGAF